MAGLASHLVVSGLLRAAEAVGGNGAVLTSGDRDTGAIVLIVTSRGQFIGLFERVSSLAGDFTWNKAAVAVESATSEQVARFIDKRERFDRDLWVVEVDVADSHRFVAESLSQT